MVPQRIRTTASSARPCSSSTAARTASMTGARSALPSRTTSCTRTRRCAPCSSTANAAPRPDASSGWLCARGGFDVLRVMIEPADDDEVVDPAGDVELLLVHEAEIAGAQEGTVVDIAQSRMERRCGLFGSAPVALADGFAGDPDLADAVGRRARAGLGLDDGHAQRADGRAAADEAAGAGRIVGQRLRRRCARGHRRGMRAPWHRFPPWVR